MRLVRTLLQVSAVALMLGAIVIAAQSPEALVTYQRALVQEQAAGDLKAAIGLYELAAKQAGTNRTLAARALLAAARCYDDLGLAEAIGKYRELAVNYIDQASEASAATARANDLSQTPMGLNFEAGMLGDPPMSWGNGGNALFPKPAGYTIATVVNGCLTKRRCVVITDPPGTPTGWYGGIVKGLQGGAFDGKHYRFRAALRVTGVNTYAQMMMRIDSNDGVWKYASETPNIHLSPTQWTWYTLDADVPVNTLRVSFMFNSNGAGQVWIAEPSFTEIRP